jgi:outer membrane protein assembly factor BamB
VVAGGKAYLRFTPPAADGKSIEDVLVCTNLADGQEVWKKTWPGGAAKYCAPNTPCVAEGRLFFAGSQNTIYCLDAGTGQEVWKSPLAVKGGNFTSSIALADGKIIVADAQLIALDAKSGAKVWTNDSIKALHNSPAVWQHQGKTYLLAGQGDQKKKEVWKTFCVDAAGGKTLWEVAGGINASPVVSGDLLAILYYETGLRVYQMTPAEAKEIANVPLQSDDNQSCTPAFGDGKVYGFVAKEGFCYDTAKKDFAWKIPAGAKSCSPILADGKLIQFAGSTLKLFEAATGKDLTPAKKGAQVVIVGHSSPALADGKLVVNAGTHLRCYDLRK